MTTMSEPASAANLTQRVRRAYDRLGLLPFSIIQLMARFSVAVVFWRSGHTKLANWDVTLQLFANEYKVPVLPPEIAAPLAATFELSCSTLLALGLLTRIATLPLIAMTLTIQLFVYPMSWPDHLVWLTFLLLLLTRGPGAISLDHLLARYFARR